MSDRDDRVPCGLYRTTRPIGDGIPAGALVYYHNHGDPGPGVYLPRDWLNNQAVFHERGTTVPDASYAETMEPLLPEGFYRVNEGFHCCAEQCTYFEEDQMVQLGYNGDADPILFTPELVDGVITLPTTGTRVDAPQLSRISVLKVPKGKAPPHELN